MMVPDVKETIASNLTSGSCHRYDYNYTNCNDTECLNVQGDVGKIPCDNGWVYSRDVYQETTVSEWDLVCHRRTLDSLANSLFFLGFFIGSAAQGILSDWFGRKITLLGTVWVLGIANVGASLSPWFSLYVVCRIVAASADIAGALVAFTLVQEIVPTSKRAVATLVGFTFTGFFGTLLPLLAYLFQDWRKYYLLIGCIGVPFTLLGFFLIESPRWLILHGRYDQAKSAVEKICRSGGKELDDKAWESIVENVKEKMVLSTESKSIKLTYIDLYRYPLTRIMTVNVMLSWFVVTMVYYGLLLNITKFAGNPYVNATINSSTNIVTNILVLLADFFGRRKTLSLSYVMAGIFCILSMVFNLNAGENQAMSTASVAMAISGKLFATLAFSLVYIVTSEVYPTSVRSLGMGLGSMTGRVGSMISPFILQLSYQVPWLTQTLFGTLSLIAGVASLLYPETRDMDLISTLGETESYYETVLPKTAEFLRIKHRLVEPNTIKVDEGDENIGIDATHF